MRTTSSTRHELKAWLADGTLSRLDVAFSRDQAGKDYVQHRMAENAADLWRWLQDGAHFYVCGDATRMARDVDAALRRIAMTEGKLDEAQARDWIVALARPGPLPARHLLMRTRGGWRRRLERVTGIEPA